MVGLDQIPMKESTNPLNSRYLSSWVHKNIILTFKAESSKSKMSSQIMEAIPVVSVSIVKPKPYYLLLSVAVAVQK